MAKYKVAATSPHVLADVEVCSRGLSVPPADLPGLPLGPEQGRADVQARVTLPLAIQFRAR